MSEQRKLSLTEAADLYGTLDSEKRAAIMAFVSYELTVSLSRCQYDLLAGPEVQIANRPLQLWCPLRND